MYIFFYIQRYTEAETLDEWIRLQQAIPKVVSKEKILSDFSFNTVETIILALGIMIILPLLVVLIVMDTMPIFYLLGICCVIVFLGFIYKLRFNYSKKPKLKTFKYFREKLHFEDRKINVVSRSKEHNHTFMYNELQDFKLCYKSDVTIFEWKTSTSTYQYTIYSGHVQKELIQVLQYLYEQNIPVREIDELGRKLHLLELVDKPIPKIDDKYQRLIDEIGEE